MTEIAILASVTIAGLALHIWAEDHCARLDVATGRRDGMALINGYGSNRGWYWRYKIPSILGAAVAAPGVLLFGIGTLVWIASN